MKWFYDLRETKRRIAKLDAEIADLKRREDIRNAAQILRNRASLLMSAKAAPSLPKSQWATYLENPNLVDEALLEAGATRTPGIEDRWLIDLTAPRKMQGRNAPRA